MLIIFKHPFSLLHGFFPTSMLLFEILLFTLLFWISLYFSFSCWSYLDIWKEAAKQLEWNREGFFGQMLLLGVDFWFILNNIWVRSPGQTTICSSNPHNECGIYSVDHMFSTAVGTVKLIRGNCGHFFCITIFEWIWESRKLGKYSWVA